MWVYQCRYQRRESIENNHRICWQIINYKKKEYPSCFLSSVTASTSTNTPSSTAQNQPQHHHLLHSLSIIFVLPEGPKIYWNLERFFFSKIGPPWKRDNSWYYITVHCIYTQLELVLFASLPPPQMLLFQSLIYMCV